ncbi:uncharacterized protein HMPREF1541_10752 [Cyphellophora europaea CBS 101466]|uniref:Uncharacterized protein n=1 Tax=Cyphellophora europaea (strain CBS 101466) TaxID=1220924 RepID=W2S664_CYPE1|nr:uncharacterized protein HMPREF1541_10752 [Cyphellophora europaea CBS 101466]ETN44201.1 hypothetical protein HMPREF1541_10752 [Cyphellophora europaea CBS 101466]
MLSRRELSMYSPSNSNNPPRRRPATPTTSPRPTRRPPISLEALYARSKDEQDLARIGRVQTQFRNAEPIATDKESQPTPLAYDFDPRVKRARDHRVKKIRDLKPRESGFAPEVKKQVARFARERVRREEEEVRLHSGGYDADDEEGEWEWEDAAAAEDEDTLFVCADEGVGAVDQQQGESYDNGMAGEDDNKGNDNSNAYHGAYTILPQAPITPTKAQIRRNPKPVKSAITVEIERLAAEAEASLTQMRSKQAAFTNRLTRSRNRIRTNRQKKMLVDQKDREEIDAENKRKEIQRKVASGRVVKLPAKKKKKVALAMLPTTQKGNRKWSGSSLGYDDVGAAAAAGLQGLEAVLGPINDDEDQEVTSLETTTAQSAFKSAVAVAAQDNVGDGASEDDDNDGDDDNEDDDIPMLSNRRATAAKRRAAQLAMAIHQDEDAKTTAAGELGLDADGDEDDETRAEMPAPTTVPGPVTPSPGRRERYVASWFQKAFEDEGEEW